MKMDREALIRALAAVRLANGGIALLAPGLIARRLSDVQHNDAALTYVLRMFGIRTIFLGLDLLLVSRDSRARSLRRSPLIHAIDAVAAGAGLVSGRLERRAGLIGLAMSTVNLGLSLAARTRGNGARLMTSPRA